jgi:hypothetical protein
MVDVVKSEDRVSEKGRDATIPATLKILSPPKSNCLESNDFRRISCCGRRVADSPRLEKHTNYAVVGRAALFSPDLRCASKA